MKNTTMLSSTVICTVLGSCGPSKVNSNDPIQKQPPPPPEDSDRSPYISMYKVKSSLGRFLTSNLACHVHMHMHVYRSILVGQQHLTYVRTYLHLETIPLLKYLKIMLYIRYTTARGHIKRNKNLTSYARQSMPRSRLINISPYST